MVSKAEGGGRVSVEQRLALTAISVSLLLLFSLWLSAAAVGPRLEAEWGLSTAQVGGLTMAVMVGFVVGSVGLIITGLPDLLPTRAMFAIATVVALSANAALVLLGPGQYRWAVVLRFLTGVGLAGGYPTAIKAVAGWFRETLGSAAGVLIGALTVGAAAPFLVAGMDLAWEQVVLASSGLAALGALIMAALVGDGPYDPPPVRFSWHDLRRLFGNRRVRLVSLAYFGHNWELFGLWTWIGVFLAASARSGGYPEAWTSPVAFAAVAIGALGAWLAGTLVRPIRANPDRKTGLGRIRWGRLAIAVGVRRSASSRHVPVRRVGFLRRGRLAAVLGHDHRSGRRDETRYRSHAPARRGIPRSPYHDRHGAGTRRGLGLALCLPDPCSGSHHRYRRSHPTPKDRPTSGSSERRPGSPTSRRASEIGAT